MRIYALLAAITLAASSRADIQYRVRLEPGNTGFDVFIETKADSADTTFKIPAWSPGYYMLANYDERIKDVEAQDGNGHPLTINHTDRLSWKVTAPTGANIRFSYKVSGNDPGLGFFGMYLDTRTGFINGASTFMYIDGRKTEPDHLDLKLPEGWDVATAMDKDDKGFVAPTGYDEFIDNPIQMGEFVRKKFTVEGIPFEAVYVIKTGKILSNIDVETERLRKVSAPAIKMFRGAGFKHYTYILHLALGGFSGGLEHRASTCIAIGNSEALNLDDLAAHENFHAWNVKQIRPFVLGPFDYTKPDRTANLWWMEGVTDYYAKVLTYRSGLQDADWLLSEIRQQLADVQSSKNRLSITLADCSRNAWESNGFGVGDLSFYSKGFMVGAILDASIRAQTDGKKSLDDVMRLLFSKYRLPNPGLQEDGILQALNEVVGKPVFNELYHSMVETTDELPYDILRNIGIEPLVAGKPYAILGYQVQDGIITTVGREASDAGVKVGDKVVSIDEQPWTGVTSAPEGYVLEVDRSGSRVKLDVHYSVLQSSSQDLLWDPTAGDLAIRLRRQWLERPDSSVKEGDKGTEGNKNGAGK